MKKTKCLRCGWGWYRRKPVAPKTCPNPKCNSPYWDTPRKIKNDDIRNDGSTHEAGA